MGMGKRQLNIKQGSNHATNFEPAALVLSTPLARRVERSGTGGGANEKSTPIGVLSVGVIVQKCNLLKSKKEDLRSKSTILFHYSLLPLT